MLEAPPAPFPLLSAHALSKRFPGVVAVDNVSLELRAGEVHALLGENGAGKTTLISMLYGLVPPDEGYVSLFGEPVRLRAPKDAIARGVGLVAQHFMLVSRHTVAENIALGLPGTPFFRPTRRLKRRILELGKRYGLNVDPNAYVYELSAGEQQRVEIMKALVRNAKILILDEPTGVLTPQEADGLFEVVRRMKGEGHGVIFITHKLGEVLDVADRITVLRKGAVVGTLPREGADATTLARMMIGRDVVLSRVASAPPRPGLVLELSGVSARNDRGVVVLKDISFRLREGEILGVAGVAGNGQLELAEVLTGHRHVTAGSVSLAGRELGRASIRETFERGVAHIPEERNGVGVVPGLSVGENLALRHYRYPPFSRGGLLNAAATQRFAEASVREYGVSTPSLQTRTGRLSGGNIQKLVLARELSERPGGAVKLVVAAHPTYGLDIGATEQTHRMLVGERDRGAGVLLISEDLEELFRLSHRIIVMFGGKVMGIVEAEGADRGLVGLMMAGGTPKGTYA
ncbi:MAG: ABC transporter, ATP-binding protein (cluster 11, riboflavin/purine nucleoside/unknown) / ABC transporter, ATP-binding protein (cluster 11, riboflavin/purine nucleoside/unknown) [uncultured Truepera sp.]|uniref:ABC transporter domain-containing protein n=1 Tax=uncultured Truepera sp. TaxID=543023 RepID=A0A6J4VXZ5_9DEIN|nr:MAG: ABC transporter, ATP-binding protein (cluster 11, riboflavin/purine nucleoside/unknown) / ABC transporter, ATP-binding protein (cluster 11, riboflavin/purine nucleoside/unknown) [uncultured Truepera sp.]